MARDKTEAAAYSTLYLRLPPPMLTAIKDQAAEGRRPVNTQVIMLLEQALLTTENRQQKEPA